MATIIDLDASGWENALNFYNALLEAFEAPGQHGKNVNGVIDSVIYGGINRVNPPLVVRFHGTQRASVDVRLEIEFVRDEIAKARSERLRSQGKDTPVEFEVID